MKILIAHDGSNAHYFDRTGLAKAFGYAGYQVMIWDIKNQAAFDVWNQFEPDIFLGQTYNVDRATLKCLLARPNVRVGLRTGDYGEANKNWNSAKYPVLLATKKDKEIVKTLVDNGRLDFLYIHYHPDYLEQTHGYWTKDYSIPVISLMNAADIFDYTKGQSIPEFQSDVCFIGGYWPYKSVTLNTYLLPLCHPQLNLDIKIFGNGWHIPQHYGVVQNETVKHLLASAIICPNISELHSQDFGWDCIERPFKLLSNKCFCLSDNVEGFKKLFPNGMEFASSPQQFVEKTLYYIQNPEKRISFIEEGYKEVMSNHTYFERAITVMDALNLTFESTKIKQSKLKAKTEFEL